MLVTRRAFAGFSAAAITSLAVAQAPIIKEPLPQPKSNAKDIPWKMPVDKLLDLSWTTEEWTADEKPFLAIRKEVEEYFQGRKTSNTKTDAFEKTRLMVVAAKANPKDPLKLFRGAYYAYMLMGYEITPAAHRLAVNPDSSFALNLDSVPSPHSREFDRLHFLIQAGWAKPYLELAERLYKHDPKDAAVAVKLVWINCFFAEGSIDFALQVAESQLKSGDTKKKPGIYYAYGLAHHFAIRKGNSLFHAKQAIVGYDKYLESGPPWRPLVPEVKSLKEAVEKYIAEHPAPSP